MEKPKYQIGGQDPAKYPPVDSTPVRMPAGFRRPPTLAEQVARLVRGDISLRAQEQGFDTFEEDQDFDVPDDPVDPSTPFEEFFDPDIGRAITPDELRRFESHYRRQYLKEQADRVKKDDRLAVFKEKLKDYRRSLFAKRSGGRPADAESPTDKAADKKD